MMPFNRRFSTTITYDSDTPCPKCGTFMIYMRDDSCVWCVTSKKEADRKAERASDEALARRKVRNRIYDKQEQDELKEGYDSYDI